MEMTLDNTTQSNPPKAMPSRGTFLRWLRRTHGWIGLWGAVFGLLFGFSGFLLNHRAVLKIPAIKMQESQMQLALPAQPPADLKAFTVWIQNELHLHHEPIQRPPRTGDKPSRDAAWDGKKVRQPAQWKVEFQTPQSAIIAEYVVGNQFATITRQNSNTMGFFTRMHKGVGMNIGWILLVDSFAGSMILLSITGVLLWTRMRGSRLTMAGIMGTAIALLLLFTLQSL
jgi:uncharacterized protein